MRFSRTSDGYVSSCGLQGPTHAKVMTPKLQSKVNRNVRYCAQRESAGSHCLIDFALAGDADVRYFMARPAEAVRL